MKSFGRAPCGAVPMVALALLLGMGSVQARTYWVGLGGTGNGCTHSSLSAAITAAANNPGPDDIRLVQGMTDSNQALAIRGQDLVIIGGYENCFDPDVGLERTVVSGLGGVAAPVFTIAGPGVVRLENLHIVSGDSPANGGAVAYRGSTQAGSVNVLVLARTVVDSNHAANDGGGIAFEAAAFVPAELILEQDTGLFRNSAGRDGGGIHLAGPVQMRAEAHRLFFWDNVAQSGSGGALYFAPGASGDIGSASWLGDPTFLRNIAALDGGAIRVLSDAGPQPGVVRLYSILPDQPLTFAQNIAGRVGGAFSVVGDLGAAGSNAGICLRNVNVLNNAAIDGAAAHVALARFGYCPNTSFPIAAQIVCTPRTLCSRIEQNRADEATPGSAVIAADGADLYLYNSSIQNNRAASHLVRQRSIGTVMTLLRMFDSVVRDNVMAASDSTLLYVGPENLLHMIHSTLAGNTAATAIDSGITATQFTALLTNSIVFHPLGEAMRANPARTVLEHVLFDRRPTGFPSSPTLIEGNPRFLNAQLELSPDSPAVDVAPPFGATVDIRGLRRPVDLLSRVNVAGPADLGAFEVQVFEVDEVFRDGYEN